MAPRASRALVAAVAAVVLAGCEDIPTESERKTLSEPPRATQDLRPGLERRTAEGPRLAREEAAGLTTDQQVYLTAPTHRSPRYRDPTYGERVELWTFARGLVAAANARDPRVCTHYFAPIYVVRTYGGESGCLRSLNGSRGRLHFGKVTRTSWRPPGIFGLEFVARAGRKTKTYRFQVSSSGGSFRAFAGVASVL